MHLQYGTMIAFFNYPSKIIHWGSDGSWNSSLAQSPQRFPAQPCPSISSRPARSSPGKLHPLKSDPKGDMRSPQETTICICQCPRNTRKWHSALNGKEKDIMGCLPQIDRGCLQSSCGLRPREPTFASSPKKQDPFQSGHTTKCKEILATTYMLIPLYYK